MSNKKVAAFHERFALLLEEKQAPMNEVAEALGVSAKTVYAWKGGTRTPKPPAVATIAGYFGVTTEWLEGYDAEKHPENKKAAPAKTVEARIISHGVDSMPPDMRERALTMFRLIFKEYESKFEAEERNDDDEA